VEHRSIWPDGTVRWLSGAGRVHLGEHSEPVRGLGISLDVTPWRKLELELRHAQKLESVGRLASGVAHEINTPMQFVSDSVHFVQDAMTDLVDVVTKYRAVNELVLADLPARSAADAATQAEQEMDLDYVLANVPAALDRSIEGLNRVTVIVQSMKDFAHPDRTEMAAVDLNRAIQSTLTIARNEYKYVADVETDFGEIPLVMCHGGDVNQAFLNIVVNAAHAIGDAIKGTPAKGRIVIQTRVDGDDVVVRISDTGGGIPETIRDQVFDPFFTTKDVGKGTGQGLAIARAVIVEKHSGDLSFETEMGHGSTFVIRLPIDARSRAGVDG
jgi:signal transduction histidine kinase